jgi:hypothetical protein
MKPMPAKPRSIGRVEGSGTGLTVAVSPLASVKNIVKLLASAALN